MDAYIKVSQLLAEGSAEDALKAAWEYGSHIYNDIDINVSETITLTGSNKTLVGGRIYSDSISNVISLSNLHNCKFIDVDFDTQLTDSESSNSAPITARDTALSGILFDGCSFSAPFVDVNGVAFSNNSESLIDGVEFYRCKFKGIGRMGLETVNHQDSNGEIRIKNISVDKCTFENTGLIGYGMGISFSGSSSNMNVTNSLFKNCKGPSVELVRTKGSRVLNNTFDSPESNTGCISITGGGADEKVNKSITISGNKGTSNGNINIHQVDGLSWSDNDINITNEGNFFLRDASNVSLSGGKLKSDGKFTVYQEGDSHDNTIMNCHIDGSTETNSAAIYNHQSGCIKIAFGKIETGGNGLATNGTGGGVSLTKVNVNGTVTTT